MEFWWSKNLSSRWRATFSEGSLSLSIFRIWSELFSREASLSGSVSDSEVDVEGPTPCESCSLTMEKTSKLKLGRLAFPGLASNITSWGRSVEEPSLFKFRRRTCVKFSNRNNGSSLINEHTISPKISL